MSKNAARATDKTKPARAIVDDVFTPRMTREIWTANYDKVLPVSIKDFDLTAVLPAVFYMFRFGRRRGKGGFYIKFGGEEGKEREKKRDATIDRVTNILVQDKLKFSGFEGETEKAILGDLLLCFCLGNVKRSLGRTEQVLRVAPTHFMSSWVDLPDDVVNLRYVPEMIFAMLAGQDGAEIEKTGPDLNSTWFPVAGCYDQNVLIKAFYQGVQNAGLGGNQNSDKFKEETRDIGLDQLLMVRIAQHLTPPAYLLGYAKPSNQHPIAEKAARHFSEDMRNFVRRYSALIPRQAFVGLLESCISVGLTTIITSVTEILFAWSNTGNILDQKDQKPIRLFVDCSNGVERKLRTLAEQSMDDLMRRIERLPVLLMALRILDYYGSTKNEIQFKNISTRPYATKWLNLLGKALFGCQTLKEFSDDVVKDLGAKANALRTELQADYPEAADMLHNPAQPNIIWRVAESLTCLQGSKNTHGNVVSLIDSALMTGRPNGLADKRTTSRKDEVSGSLKKRDLRSLVFSDSVLEYLVHLLVLDKGIRQSFRPISFKDFVEKIYERYGFCVDVAPDGMTVSNDLLKKNREVLEKRLRELGLLVGVNDAESMKYVKPRFNLPEE